MLLRVAALVLALTVASCGDPGDPDTGLIAHDSAGIDQAPPSLDATVDARDVAPTVDVLPIDAPLTMLLDTGSSLDASGLACGDLDDAYTAAARDSRTCTAATDCAATVCETLCCACRVYVNPRAPLYRRLAEIQLEWNARGCANMVACPPYACPPATETVCSSTYHCVTLRRSSGG